MKNLDYASGLTMSGILLLVLVVVGGDAAFDAIERDEIDSIHAVGVENKGRTLAAIIARRDLDPEAFDANAARHEMNLRASP